MCLLCWDARFSRVLVNVVFLLYLILLLVLVESTPPYTFAEDEDIEEEFKKLELEIVSANRVHPIPIPKTEAISAVRETEALESTEQVADALSKLKIVDNPVKATAGSSTAVNKTENLEVQFA